MRRNTRSLLAFLLAASAGAAIAAAIAYTRRSRIAGHAAYPPSGHFVPTPHGRVHLLARGAGRPVALVHGADGVLLDFERTLLDAIAVDHLAIAVDRPGHGYSEALRASPDGILREQAEAVRAAVRPLCERPPVLLGHSYGAALSLRWALDHPDEVAALVLVAPAAYPAWPDARHGVFAVPGTPAGRAVASALVPLGTPVLTWSNRRAFHPQAMPDAFAHYTRAMSLRPAQFVELVREYRWLVRDLAAMAPHYAEVRLPVEIVVGDRDQVTVPKLQAEPLAREIPGAGLTVLPGVGHQPHWSHPDAVLQALRRAEERAAG